MPDSLTWSHCKTGCNMADKIDLLRAGAAKTGFTIDFLADLTYGLDLQASRKVISNAAAIPSYKKSSDNPYLWRMASAPSSDRR